MNPNQFEQQATNFIADSLSEQKLSQKYNVKITSIVLSFCYYLPNGIFLEGNFCRKLSINEILNPIEYFNVDFPKYGLLPIFDCGDNDFLVYRFSDGKWLKFNIVDEISYHESEDWKTLI